MGISRGKVCLVIPSLQAGGMERVMSELVTYFCKDDSIEVHLVLYGIKREIFYNIPENVTIHKPEFAFDNTYRTWNTVKTIYWLRKKIKSVDPVSVLSFGELWNNFVLLSTLRLRYNVFVSDRCKPDKSLGRIHDSLRKWLYPKAAGVICQTETAKEVYKTMFDHSNYITIGNPIRDIQTNPAISKENIVLSVGRLISTKHHDELIRIFHEVNPPDWKLVIVGGDALKQQNLSRLQGLVNDLGMQTKIELAGKKSNVEDYYNQAEIFAFTSSSEGFPNVIGEAMSSGLPVIAYDCVAGPKDLIDDGKSGYLVALHDTLTFSNKLKKLVEDSKLRNEMGLKGQEKMKQYSVSIIGAKFKQAILNENIAN